MTEIYREDISRIVCDTNIPGERLRDKDILITGATGLLGTLLVRSIIAIAEDKGFSCRIHAFVRDEKKAKALFSENVSRTSMPDIIVGDIREFRSYEGHLDYIIHAAGETSSKAFIENPVETIETSVLGTFNMLHMAKEKHVQGMVFLSTMEVYGAPSSDDKISESRMLGTRTDEVRNAYPIGKIASENLCIAYAREYGIPVNILRLSQTFGAGVNYNDGRVFAEFARCAVEGRDILLKTKGETRRSYLYTTDAMRAILTVLLFEKEEGRGISGEIYNVANEETYCSIKEMAELVLRTCGNGGQSVRFDLSSDTEKLGYAPTLHMNLDTKKLRSLGWKPEVGLEEMYRRLCGDMRG